jgi:hypothetical protein
MNVVDLLIIGVAGAMAAYLVATWSVVRTTRDPSIAVTLLLALYWTLVGALPVLLAKRHDAGARYSYLEERLFPIEVDDVYVRVLVAYTAFLLAVVVTVAVVARARTRRSVLTDQDWAARVTRSLSHERLLAICGALLAVRLALLLIVTRSGASLYTETRVVQGANARLLLVYQYLTLLGAYAGFIGAGLWLACRSARHAFRPAHRRTISVAYAALALLVLAENALVGNRAVPLIGLGAVAVLWLRYRWMPVDRVGRQTLLAGVATVGLLAVLFLGAVGVSRGAAVTSPSTAATVLVQTASDPGHVFEEVAASSEKLAAHMSLYGVLANGTADTRPFTTDTYGLYARTVGAPADQVFTIHFVTSWVLQVGPVGVLAAAVALGLVIGALQRVGMVRRSRPTTALALCAGSLAAAGIPIVMVRGGVESLWGIVQLMVLPAIPLALAMPASRAATCETAD